MDLKYLQAVNFKETQCKGQSNYLKGIQGPYQV